MMNISFVLVNTAKPDAERASNKILCTIPELGFKDLSFRPSDLQEVFDTYQENENLKLDESDEAEEKFSKWIKQVKSSGEPFYAERSKLDWDSFQAIMEAVAPVLDSLTPASVADPLLSAKRYAAKAVKVQDATDGVDYLGHIRTALDLEIQALEAIYAKAQSVSSSTFTAFITEKAQANGTDEKGYAKLRSKKEKAESTEGTTED